MTRPLKMFMRGKSVSMLQDLLRSMGYSVEDKPNMFGASTRDAVKGFQRQRGLKTTGLVDAALLQMMQGTGGSSVQKKRNVNKSLSSDASPTMVSEERFDALVRLLMRKGLLNEQELKDEMKRVLPVSVTQSPLV